MLAKKLRTSRERTLFGISVVFSAVVWLLLTVSMIGILYAGMIALAVLVAHCLFMAYVIGNGVRVGPQQLPELWVRVEAAARKLGLDRTPETYILQSGGLLNAFATKILSRRFIILYSDLVEACGIDSADGRPTELDFVIGHELGHLAAGHLGMRWFLLPSFILPLVGAAYSRACEYTCDRCGHAVVDDLGTSSRALAILAAGPKAARRMNLDAFVDQRRDTGSFWMAVYELNATHPFLSKRVAALREWQSQGAASPVGRNVLAYPAAPFFAAAAGNPAGAVLFVLVFVAIAATSAFPLFMKRIAAAKGLGGRTTPSSLNLDDLRLPPLGATDTAGEPAPTDEGAAGDDEFKKLLERTMKERKRH